MILLADIGGSNFRYTFFNKGKISSIIKENCDDFRNPLELLDKIYKEQKFDSALLAVAGPVDKGKVCWTNRKWTLSVKQLTQRYHLKKMRLYNDMEAQGYALKTRPQKKSLLMNIGTGLGACFIYDKKVFPCEFGLALDENNNKKETLLSASGIVQFYHQQGGDKKVKSAKLIDELRKKKDEKAIKAYQLFYQLWGKTAGNIITGLRVDEALFLWGGLVPKSKKDMTDFLRGLHHKNYPVFTQKIPVKLVKSQSLTIKGLMNLIKDEFF